MTKYDVSFRILNTLADIEEDVQRVAIIESNSNNVLAWKLKYRLDAQQVKSDLLRTLATLAT